MLGGRRRSRRARRRYSAGVLPDRLAVACARSSSATSAATARRDTTCPGRNASGPCGAYLSRRRWNRSAASWRLFGPSAAVFHSAPSGSSIDDEGRLAAHASGARRMASSSPSISWPSASISCHCSSLYGLVTRGASQMRVTCIRCSNSISHSSMRAGHRRRRARFRRARQRNMAFAGEQAGGRIEPDPAGAGQVDLGPGVQVGEVRFRARRAVERLHVGGELDQVAGNEARGQAEMAQHLHQQPGRVAARAGTLRQRFLRRLHARFHADHVADVRVQAARSARPENRRCASSCGECPPGTGRTARHRRTLTR